MKTKIYQLHADLSQNDEITFELTGIDKDLFNLSFDGLNATIASDSKDYENPQDSDLNNAIYSMSILAMI